MYIFDLIFGFIPILLVAFFIVRIVSAAVKKKKREQDGAGKRKNPAAPASGAVPSPPTPADRTSPSPPSPSVTTPQAPSPAHPETSAAEKQYLKNEQNMEKREKIILSESEAYEATGISEAAMARLNRLPELKKAVLWAEILGTPKGLE